MAHYAKLSAKINESEREIQELVTAMDFEACSKAVQSRHQLLVELDNEYQRLVKDQPDSALLSTHKLTLETVQKNDQRVLQRLEELSSSLIDDRRKHLKAKRAVDFYKKTLSSF